jgi:hypothetical protein
MSLDSISIETKDKFPKRKLSLSLGEKLRVPSALTLTP